MKKMLVFIISIHVQILYSQFPCEQYLCLDFDDTTCIGHLNIDTIGVRNNLWQTGMLNKPYFVGQGNFSEAIVTDLSFPYAPNSYSTFTIRYQATDGDIYGFKMISGIYNVQTDSLKDFGKMEFSPDKGLTWVDLLTDTIGNAGFIWNSKPVLTGNSNGWQYYDMFLADIRSFFNIRLGDTLLYRFSFISDSIEDDLGGIMFDDICFGDFVEGISDIIYKPIKSIIYPNPSQQYFTIEFENPASGLFQLAVYSIKSELIFTQENISDSETVIDCKFMKPGIYIYKLTNAEAQTRSWGKFIVTK